MKEGKESLRKKRLRKENMKKPLKVGVLKAFTDFLIAQEPYAKWKRGGGGGKH